MDFTPKRDDCKRLQEQKLMKREPLSPILNSNQAYELLEFGTSPHKIFYESSLADTRCDWIDDSALILNHCSPDYMCDFWEEDFVYLNGLVTAGDDPTSQITMAASKLENNAPMPKSHHDQLNVELSAKIESVEAENNIPIGFGKAAESKMKGQTACKKVANASTLTVDEIQKYFDMPISKAAKKMSVGLTGLKKRCRELNILRWPHRKIMSLKSLINNAKELGLEKELEKVEDHKRIVEKMPHVEFTDTLKKLRQACFKAKYKKKKQMRAAGRFH